MLPKSKLHLVVLLLTLRYAKSFKFEDAGTSGVEFGESTDSSQIVRMNEINNGNERIKVVKITGTTLDSIEIEQVSQNFKNFNLNKEEDSGNIYILSDPVDYEALDNEKRCLVNIIDSSDSTTITLSVEVNNMDDENPTITSQGNCEMNENTIYSASSSNCEFQVSDRDGWLNYMDFSGIEGTRGEESIFEFGFKETIGNTTYTATAYLYLKDGIELDYENVTLYTFTLRAKDNGKNPTTPESVPIIVTVIDQPDQPPVWDSNFRSAITVTEEQETPIQVSAKDGDYGINNNIIYQVSDLPDGIDIKIEDENIGKILIGKIDRDIEDNDYVTFTVTAIEKEEPSSTLSDAITLIVSDIDDNIPEISATGADENKAIEISIDETSSEIPQDIQISVSDLDFGENAIYTAQLDQDLSSVITIVPSRGYQNTSLSLTILDPTKLDYEDEAWRTIEMTLTTNGTTTPSNSDYLYITINLNDLNDEYPKFAQEIYSVHVKEDVTIDTIITSIQATDKDAEDIKAGLRHELVGTLSNNILQIEELGGNIITIIDDAFDYEKQSEVVVQIRATDAAGQQGTAQLTIEVEDVNDEDPRMVVSSAITVEENQDDGYQLETSITASDEDTDPDLVFSIDWSKSYAAKNSQRQEITGWECITVETVTGDNNQTATAHLFIKETQPENTPDFEVFDTLYLQLVVTDKNTENLDKKTGTDTALVIINIVDVNDNEPVFADGTEDAKRQVTENTASGTLITSVVATDNDVGANLTYSIESADEDTPNWVAIDPRTGSISVSLEGDEQIDCDDPIRYNLTYTVTVTDGLFNTSTTIKIGIIDANDVTPVMANQEASIREQNEINDDDPENPQDGTIVLQLNPTDGDRDAPYNTVVCVFGDQTPTTVTNRFSITDDNTIIVAKTNGATLNREEYSNFTFPLNCYDDPRRQGPISLSVQPAPQVTITLTNVNDKVPDIKNKAITSISENNSGDISPVLEGEDEDGDNIIFTKIRIIERFLDKNQEKPLSIPDEEVFEISTVDDKNGLITIKRDNLRDYYGYIVLSVTLTDVPMNEADSPLTNEVNVTLEVSRFNFEELKFFFPVEGTTYYLQSSQSANSALYLWNGEDTIQSLNATDQQDDKYKIRFEVVDDSGLFVSASQGDTTAQLQMTSSSFTRQKYSITVMATIDGDNVDLSLEKPYSKNCTINIDFFDANVTDPVFKIFEDSVDFPENNETLSFAVPKATYPDLDEEITASLDVVYLLRQGDESLFEIDSGTGVLTLLQALDYETQTSYDLVVQSSNSQNLKPNPVNETKYKLTVNVVDVNDEPPIFDPKSYTTILNIADGSSGVAVQTVTATDIDTTSAGKLRFSIESITGSTDELNKITDSFVIDKASGEIKSSFSPKDGLKGFFTLQIIVRDEDDSDEHMDRAEVIVYLVTNDNVIGFTFENDRETVYNAAEDIRTILDNQFGSKQYVSNVASATSAGTTDDGSSRAISSVFFVNTESKQPVEATEIYKEVTNVNTFRDLRNAFLEKGLYLLSFDSETDTTQNMEDILKAWLIGVSVVLGSLCVILLAAFILKTRALNQRINKLSNTKFGSQESGLNRTGVAAPTTNKHAVEGSNPVYNNEVDTRDIDRRSVTSGDSDLIGVEDDEKFNYNRPIED